MKISGEIVWEHTSYYGKYFRVEKLIEPKLVGAGLREYRLWCDDVPASGGQWHYTLDSAIHRAEYLSEFDTNDKIKYLEDLVNKLERELWKLKKELKS